MAVQYTPSHSALNIELDFEGSLMDVDAAGHRCIEELAVRAGRTGDWRSTLAPVSRLTVASGGGSKVAGYSAGSNAAGGSYTSSEQSNEPSLLARQT